MRTEPLALPKAVDPPLVPRPVRVLLALALGAVSTLVVLASFAGLTWPGNDDGLLVALIVAGLVGCSVSVRLAVHTSLRP